MLSATTRAPLASPFRLPTPAGAQRLAVRAMSVPVPGTPPRRTDALRGGLRCLAFDTHCCTLAAHHETIPIWPAFSAANRHALPSNPCPRLQLSTACPPTPCPPSAPSARQPRSSTLRPLSLLCPSPSRRLRLSPPARCRLNPLPCWLPWLRRQNPRAALLPHPLQLPPLRRPLPPLPHRRPCQWHRSRRPRPSRPLSTQCWMPHWCTPLPAPRRPSARPHLRRQWTSGRLMLWRMRARSAGWVPALWGGPRALLACRRPAAAWKTSRWAFSIE